MQKFILILLVTALLTGCSPALTSAPIPTISPSKTPTATITLTPTPAATSTSSPHPTATATITRTPTPQGLITHPNGMVSLILPDDWKVVKSMGYQLLLANSTLPVQAEIYGSVDYGANKTDDQAFDEWVESAFADYTKDTQSGSYTTVKQLPVTVTLDNGTTGLIQPLAMHYKTGEVWQVLMMLVKKDQYVAFVYIFGNYADMQAKADSIDMLLRSVQVFSSPPAPTRVPLKSKETPTAAPPLIRF